MVALKVQFIFAYSEYSEYSEYSKYSEYIEYIKNSKDSEYHWHILEHAVNQNKFVGFKLPN